MMAQHDALTAFRAAMGSAGVVPAEPFDPSRGLVRFRCEGDGKGKRNGWAILHFDGAVPCGAFGNWRTGASHKWRPGDESRALTVAERRALIEHAKRREAERLAEQERAADWARTTWQASPLAEGSHPYLVRKGLASHGLRQRGQTLLVPLIDGAGKLWNLQRIAPDGRKLFVKGARAGGLFSPIGTGWPLRGPIVLAEGWATGAAIHEATGHAVVAAMSAGNLLPVARIVRRAVGGQPITIAADWDGATDGNPGMRAAIDAGQRVLARVAIPVLPDADRAVLVRTVDFADLPRVECASLIAAARGVARG